MIVGAVLVAIVAIVVVVKVLGGSSSSGTATTPALITSAKNAITHTSATHSSSEASTPAVSPAETSVTVLNGTETSELAHRFATNLQQDGYTKASALRGSPPGSHQTSVVEYSNGHRAEAEAVAKSISVSNVRSLESGVAALSNGATVVVLLGADKASSATSGGGEESAAGTSASG
jgi:hypothetical protein